MPARRSRATRGNPDQTPQDELLASLAKLHQRFADGGMALEDFEAARDDIAGRLRVD